MHIHILLKSLKTYAITSRLEIFSHIHILRDDESSSSNYNNNRKKKRSTVGKEDDTGKEREKNKKPTKESHIENLSIGSSLTYSFFYYYASSYMCLAIAKCKCCCCAHKRCDRREKNPVEKSFNPLVYAFKIVVIHSCHSFHLYRYILKSVSKAHVSYFAHESWHVYASWNYLDDGIQFIQVKIFRRERDTHRERFSGLVATTIFNHFAHLVFCMSSMCSCSSYFWRMS